MINISDFQYVALTIFASIGAVCVIILVAKFILDLMSLLDDEKYKVNCSSMQEAKELKKKLNEMRDEKLNTF